MPQKRPSFQPGQYYHIYNRGAHRVTIFREPDNYVFVLRKIRETCVQLNLKMVAYCLMPNHYHWLVRQDGDYAAGLLPQRVFNSYSKAYNKRYQHSGTLFEDNYKIKVIQSTPHLLHLCRYIHGNPVKDGLVADPVDWEYSNYQEWIGERPGTLFDPDFVRDHFRSSKEYRSFVIAGLAEKDLPPAIKIYIQMVEGNR